MAESGHSSMACETVEDRLLDLVYGELGEAEAREIRAHAESCEGCRRSLARLEGGRAIARTMEVAEPRADLFEAVQAAARARAEQVTAAAAEARKAPASARPADASRSRAPAGIPRSWWSEVIRWMGSMAMGPQVAMATLLLLMVGIGLWSLPRLQGGSVAMRTDEAVVGPDPGGDARGSQALAPAEPLAFDFDPHTRRLAPVGDETGAIEPEPQTNAPTTTEARPTVIARRRAAPSVLGAPQAQPEAPPQAAGDRGDEEAAALAMLEDDLAPGESVGAREPETTTRAASDTSRGAYAATQQAEATSAPPPPSMPVAPTAPDVERPQPDTDAMLASAAHRQARDAAALGSYGECVRQYDALLARWPRYAEAGRALLELAECQRRMGRIQAAEHSLERAARFPSVRPEAERALARVRMEYRAPQLAPSSAAAPP